MGFRKTLAAAAAALPLLALTALPAARAQATPSLRTGLLARSKAADMSSINWAGYATPAPAGHAVTAVHTKFVVPETQTVSIGGAAMWTGIGGFGTGDLIQAGVSTGDLLYGTYAWFEMLPDPESILVAGCSGDPTCTVNVGDTVAVDIVSKGGDRWVISMNDFHHWTWAKSFTYQSQKASAEWILEATSLIAVPMFVPFMNDVTFGTGDTFALDNGKARPIAAGHPTSIAMSLGGVVPEAKPSPLAADGDRFRGCAFKSACPAP